MDCSWEHTKLAGCWTVLYVAFILPLLKTPLELSRGQVDGDKTLGSQGGETPGFYIISTVYHGTPSSRAGLRKFFTS